MDFDMTGSSSRLDECRETLAREFMGDGEPHLLDRLRMGREGSFDAETLARICGVKPGPALDLLARYESCPESLAALMLVPVVLVAWADRRVRMNERGAILDAAESCGIRRGTPAFNVLGRWLHTRPSRALLDAWIAYVAALCSEFDTGDRQSLAERILQPAREIAGRGFRIKLPSWRRESRVLDRLAEAFESPTRYASRQLDRDRE
jgi:hypothetical protein